MKKLKNSANIEGLEQRRLFAWSSYAQLVDQDTAAASFPNATGAGVTVAVIDTGIDYTQSVLGGGFGAGFRVKGGYDFYQNDSNPIDTDGHGTAVASVIAAKPYTVNGITYQGAAPNASLVALRVGTSDSISNANIEKALRWVINNYKTYGISVVNLSLGSGNFSDRETSAQLSDEFQTLHDKGIFVTAASGNSNEQLFRPIETDGVAYPAADPNVFAVGAVNSNDVITTWTQRGDELDLLAPGVDIVMPKLGGGFVTEDGTSFASPYVAGAAALIKQADPTLNAGDIGSILMSSGVNNRDGAGETGDTTTLQFSRLDIANALTLTQQREGNSASLNFGSRFDTALDSNGVLHAVFYDTTNADVLYATRNTSGLWSKSQIVDASGDVGAQVSLAVDSTGKIGVAYFDVTNTSVKYAQFNGTSWATQQVESKKHVGTSPSVGFDIDGNVYLAYYRRSGGDLRLAFLNRDSGSWIRQTIDGLDGHDVGGVVSLDVGEAPLRNGPFTFYDTTVAMAYSDATSGDLKYARLDIDDSLGEWFISTVEDADGVANIDLNLHEGVTVAGLQAQIAYQDTARADVKYAYRNTDWFVESVATTGKLGDFVQLSFAADDTPMIAYYDRLKKIINTSTRISANDWSAHRTATSSGPMSLSTNERSSDAILSWLNRPRSDVFSTALV